jgi:cation:H+ antiporter
MTMTGLVIVGLVLRPKRGAFRLLTWITAGLVLLFALNAAVLFQTGG